MLEINGKYNSAKIYTDNIDEGTKEQITLLCNQSSFKNSKIIIMPDCHVGKGCVIGNTMTIQDKIIPNFVGVDIGCGLSMIPFYAKNIDFDKLDSVIKTYVPYGFKIHNKSKKDVLDIFNINLEDIKCYVNIDRAYKSLGTLGGGNHFIEVDKDKNNNTFLVVHSGSRHLGLEVANAYQNMAVKYNSLKYKTEKNKLIKLMKEQGLEYDIENKLGTIPKPPVDDLCYLEGDLMREYLYDMQIVQQFASINRTLILAEISYNYYNVKDMSFKDWCEMIHMSKDESIHNYIDLKNKILRKGAISALNGEFVIIPINMKDGTIIGTGKGNIDWNYSSPHGAGRLLSRREAKKQLNLNTFKKEMEGIFTTCINEQILDEAPGAYKPIDNTINNIKDTVKIKDIIKPIYNFKAQ